MSTPALTQPPSALKKKAAPLANAIGKAKKNGFVPFAGDPASQRPTKQQSRDEINAIRKAVPDVPVEDTPLGPTLRDWMNTPKVAKRTTESI